MSEERGPWWKGRRGEWYVAGQLALMALVFFGPRSAGMIGLWPLQARSIYIVAGIILMIGGTSFLVAGLIKLRSNLTPLPHPVTGATLVDSGPYAVVRHPMYSGGIVLAYGWAVFVQSWLTLAYATLLLLFLQVKADREERWLCEAFPDYGDYQRRVPKLIPFINSLTREATRKKSSVSMRCD